MPTGAGTPSKPASRTARRKAWTEVECGLEGRSTCGPARTTCPALAIPPGSCSSATLGGLGEDLVGGRQPGGGRVVDADRRPEDGRQRPGGRRSGAVERRQQDVDQRVGLVVLEVVVG